MSNDIPEVELCRLHYAFRNRFEGHALANLRQCEVNNEFDREFQRTFEMRTELPAEGLKAENAKFSVLQPVNFRFSTKTGVPASWWQAFKAQVFPAWARRRWPPVWRTVVHDHKVTTWNRQVFEVGYTAYAAYPKLPIIMPDECGPYFIVRGRPVITASLAEYLCHDNPVPHVSRERGTLEGEYTPVVADGVADLVTVDGLMKIVVGDGPGR